MSATQVSIRLGVEGKAEVKRAFEEVGQAGGQAFGQVDRALEKTGAATDRETARFKRLAEAARMAAQADAAQGRFNQVLGVDRQAAGSARASAEIFEQAAREGERYEARARALRATLDPLAAAQDRLNRELAEYAALAGRGAITSAEQAVAQGLARQRYVQTAQAIRGVGGASRLTRNQLLTLQYTFNDVVASLSTGMSPLTILMQQGGQVTQAFGGLRGTLAAFGSALGVVGGVVAGVAVAAAGLTAAWVANDSSTRAAATALAGLGRASGATAAELENVALAAADAGGLSVTAAREMEVALLRAGRIGAGEIGRAISVARDFAVTLGVDAKAGAEQLAAALADPVRGADQLNARLGFLDDRTRQYIRTLADQNERTQAQRVLLDALVPALADAEEATNAFGRAWAYVARQASNAFDAVGKAVDRAVDGRSPQEELDLLRWQRQQLLDNAKDGDMPLMLPQVEERIRLLQNELDRQQRKAQLVAQDIAANELSIRAGEVARDIAPGFRELERLKAQQAALKSALDDPLARGKLADLALVEDAYRRITQRIEAYKPPLEGVAKAEAAQAKAARDAAEALDRKSEAAAQAARRMREGQENEIELLTRRLALQGADAAQRDQLLAGLRAEQDLRRRGIDLAGEEGRAILENAGRIERLTQQLQAQDAAYRAIETAVGSALDRFGEVLSQGKLDWKSWADAGRSALQDLTREMVKLALLNPLKNLLFGSSLPTFSQGMKLFSRLFHDGGLVGAGGVGRVVPASLFLGAPRFHDGAFLKPDEVPAILQRGERVLNRNEARAYERGPSRRGQGAVVNVTIQTPNPSAFDASRGQIAAGLARAVQSGMRGL
jgi:phage-related minor tail protein